MCDLVTASKHATRVPIFQVVLVGTDERSHHIEVANVAGRTGSYATRKHREIDVDIASLG